MLYLELHVTDCLDDPGLLRTEWIHRDHIETIEAWPDSHDPHRAWLELSLTSGRVRFVPIGLDPGIALPAAAGRAVRTLLERDSGAVAAAR